MKFINKQINSNKVKSGENVSFKFYFLENKLRKAYLNKN